MVIFIEKYVCETHFNFIVKRFFVTYISVKIFQQNIIKKVQNDETTLDGRQVKVRFLNHKFRYFVTSIIGI